jgi:hypothetical protein
VRRLGGRFAATFRSRLGPNTMWFVYDMLEKQREPTVRTLPLLTGKSLIESEREWRRRRWSDSWQVASLR